MAPKNFLGLKMTCTEGLGYLAFTRPSLPFQFGFCAICL